MTYRCSVMPPKNLLLVPLMSILLNVFPGDGLRSGVNPLAVNKYIVYKIQLYCR